MTQSEKRETLQMFKAFPRSVKLAASLSVKLAELRAAVKEEQKEDEQCKA